MCYGLLHIICYNDTYLISTPTHILYYILWLRIYRSQIPTSLVVLLAETEAYLI